MKLSKVLSLVLAVVMLFGMQSFAFTDVAATANYAEAVQVLSALDILKGYDDGSFKPEGKITRAEYATIVCRILNMNDAGATQVGGYFTDVTADHWASGYIATASQLGIVNGMGDGTFAPEAEVTYEQSVAMLVRALGYELKAQSMGGYPTGYMMIANQESITVGTTNTAGGASRATVARLTYNALTVPMMGQTEWGADAKFAPQKGESILFSKLDAVKAEATIVEVPLNPEAETIDLSNVKYDKVAVENGYKKDVVTSVAGVKINGVDLVGLQGVRATVILDKSEGTASGDMKLVAVVAKSGKNVELTIAPSLFDQVYDVDNSQGASDYATYYKTSDDDKLSEIKLDSKLTYYVNLDNVSSFTFKANDNDVAYKFVDTDNNGAYDVVFVENEAVFVVDKVVGNKIYKAADSKTNVKATYTDTALKLDAEDEKTTWSIVDAEGNALEVADIKAGDVLAVKASTIDSYTYYEITVTNEVVEGTITETYKEDLKFNKTVNMFKIGDAAYSCLTDKEMAPGKTITAKVYNGKVVAYEVAAGIENYGLIVNAGVASGLETEYQVQILTQKGELATLVLDETAVPSPAPSATPDVKTAYPVGKLIAYELNKDGEIKAADVQGVTFGNVLTEGGFDNKSGATGKYKETAEKFDAYFITENTIVFTTDDTISKDTVSLGSVNIFTEDLESKFAVIHNDAKEAVAIVLIGVNAAIDYNTYPIYVTKVSDTVVDGEQTKKITGYVADAEGYIDEDVKAEFIVASKAKTAATNLNVGDIAFFATNAAGEITDANVVAKKDGKDYKVLDHAMLTANASLDEGNKASAEAKWVTLKGTEIKVDTTNTATKWAQDTKLMTWDGTQTKDADLKGFGISGKAYNVRNTLVRLLNAANYGATFTTTTVDGQTVAVRAYDESKIKDAYVTDEISAIVYNAVNGKVSISSLDALETDHSVSDKDYGTQLENDDLVYIYSYDDATKLILIVDVNGDN